MHFQIWFFWESLIIHSHYIEGQLLADLERLTKLRKLDLSAKVKV